MTSISVGGATTIIRAFRILRALRLLKRAHSLQMIFNTFIVTLPALANFGSLLLFLLYMYSVIGMQTFGTMQRTQVMNTHLNFENFGNSFVTLFIVTTGDAWSDIMNAFA